MKLDIQDKQDIFVYKLTADNGGAPCVQDGMLSLCICKPRIRKSAKEGDWIIGLGGKALGGRVIYVAQVCKTLLGGEYYGGSKGRYTGRRDCIYRWSQKCKIYTPIKAPLYHGPCGDSAHDLGSEADGYKKAFCLTSKQFIYFGENEMQVDANLYASMAKIRDYRKNHDSGTRRQWIDFMCRANQEFEDKYKGRQIAPTHKCKGCKCPIYECKCDNPAPKRKGCGGC